MGEGGVDGECVWWGVVIKICVEAGGGGGVVLGW